MKNITIVPYRPEFFDAMCEIHDPARMNELTLAGLKDAFLPLTVAAEREGLFDYIVDAALMDGVPVGFCAYTAEELAWLYVAPEHVRKGIGTALIENAIKTEPGICELEVLEGNYPARRLYEKMGFALKKTVHGIMPGNEEFHVTVWCMARE